MKKLIIFVLVLVLLAAGAFGYLITHLNEIAMRFKPAIESAAGDALGSPITFDTIEASVFPEAELVLMGFNSGSADSNDLSFEKALLKVSLQNLLSGNLEIEAVELVAPVIKAVKDPSGITIKGLASSGKKTRKQKDPQAAAKKSKAETETSDKVSPVINIDRISISHGRFSYLDPELRPTPLVLSDLEVESDLNLRENIVSLTDLRISSQLDNSIPISIQGGPLSINQKEKRISPLKTSVEFDRSKIKIDGDLNYGTGSGTINLTDLDFDIPSLITVAKTFKPELLVEDSSGSIGGDISTTLDSWSPLKINGKLNLTKIGATFNGNAVTDVEGTINIISDSPQAINVSCSDLAAVVKGAPLKAGFEALYTPSKTSLSSLVIQMFDGTINLKGWKTAPQSQINVKASELNLASLMEMAAPESKISISGTLESADLTANTSTQYSDSPYGNGDISIKDGSIKQFNLLQKVLQEVRDLPFISESLYDAVPENSRDELDRPDTPIENMLMQFNFGREILQIKRLEIESNLFTLEVKGTAGFDGTLKLSGSIIMNEMFSQALAGQVKELKYALQRNQLILPLVIEGTTQDPVVLPDVEKLIKTGAKNALEDKAADFLGRALKDKDKKGSSSLKDILDSF